MTPGDTKKKQPNRLSQYQGGEDELSYKQLRFTTWYVRHKIVLRKLLIAVLILWSAATLGYSTFQWGNYFIFGLFEDRDLAARQVNEIENYSRIQPLYGARPLTIKRPRVFTINEGKYDFFSEAVNPNDRWIARILYKFVYAGGETESKTSLVLPRQLQILSALGQEASVFPSSARLVIERIAWEKVDAHEIADVEEYINIRQDFSVGGIEFISRTTGAAPSDRLQFTVTNNSAYGYWNPVFTAVFLNRGDIVGVRNITTDQLAEGQSASFDLRFHGPLITITDVDVVPLVNVFDDSVYMEPSS